MTIYEHNYNVKNFTKHEFVCLKLKSREVKEGDKILMSNGKLFDVDYIEKEYISDEVGDLYDYTVKEEDIKIEHTKYQFIDEDNGGKNGKCFKEIPFDAEFTVLRLINIEP
jgi:hypothetical protein